MGFFSKLFKGIKKVFKKIGRGIKKAFKSIGKFMGKIGIVGQIGLALLTGGVGIGAFLGKAAGSMMATSLGGVAGAVIKGAGHVLNAAVNLGSKVSGAFKTVSEGVVKFGGDIVKATVGKIPGGADFVKGISQGKINITETDTFANAFKGASEAITNTAGQVKDIFSVSTFTEPNKYLINTTMEAAANIQKVQKVGIPADSITDVQMSPVPGSPQMGSPAQLQGMSTEVAEAFTTVSPEGKITSSISTTAPMMSPTPEYSATMASTSKSLLANQPYTVAVDSEPSFAQKLGTATATVLASQPSGAPIQQTAQAGFAPFMPEILDVFGQDATAAAGYERQVSSADAELDPFTARALSPYYYSGVNAVRQGQAPMGTAPTVPIPSVA